MDASALTPPAGAPADFTAAEPPSSTPPFHGATGVESRIRVLPPEVTSRIAAGEVVERPFSVVKELLENAFDAGARRVRVDLSGGGVKLIRVSDDGLGMSPEDLALCVLPHATSKLVSADDLTALNTLGFRGEALPSIAAVSKFTLTSRRRGSPKDSSAWKIELTGGLPREPHARPAGAASGTSVEARELFFNLPARARFLKGPAAEAAACTETVLRLALSRPDVGIALYQDDLEIIDLPSCAQTPDADKASGHAAPPLTPAAYMSRARAVLGTGNAKGLLEVDTAPQTEHFHGYRLFGLLSPPAVTRPNRTHIYLCINGRPVKDRTLTSALLEAYRHLLPPRRFPVGVLYLEMPPADVDINVHPTKAEVRFRAPGLVYALLHHAVRVACGVAPLASSNHEQQGPGQDRGEGPGAWGQKNSGTTLSLESDPVRPPAPVQKHLDLWQHVPPARTSSYGAPSGITSSIAAEAAPRRSQSSQPYAESGPMRAASARGDTGSRVSGLGSDNRGAHAVAPDPIPQTPDPVSPRAETARREFSAPAPAADTRPFRILGQAAGMYIVMEDDTGVKIVDQHALHERILFEQLLARARSNSRGDAQGLLVPDQIDLSPVQAAVFHQDSLAIETLRQIGFDVEVSSTRTLSVLAVPTIIKRNAAAAVRDVLDALASSGDDMSEKKPLTREHYREKAAYILSCKGAIKAGERLTVEQMTAMMSDFKKITGESGFTCPHGRPLAMELSWLDIEKAVDRA